MGSTTTRVSLAAQLQGAQQQVQHLVERIEAELGFARRLCALRPGQAAAWEPLIARAEARVAAALGDATPAGMAAAVAEAEAILAPLGAAAKAYTVHLVGHAHIDMNWMWSWPETVAVTIDTFATVLTLMDEFPGFCFSQSQASVYRIMEERRPDLLARIAARVKEGRWEVTASHWVEGDKNLAGGESLCRHLLYTREYMQQLFGLAPEDVPIDWSPDTFGHAATVPTYLARGGVQYLYLHRPGVQTPSKPGMFWWEGPDGARVLVRNDMQFGYNGVITPGIAQFLADFVVESGGADYMFVFGVGDHGGGPTRRDLLRAVDMQAWPIFPTVAFSTARAFYDRMARVATLPVITGELNCEFTGCYTTQTLIKKGNRFAEARLCDAETAAALAWAAAGLPYPGDGFRQGWRDTLFSHFHDILPGSGVHDTRTYTHGLFQQTMAMSSAAETQALRALARRVDTTAAGPADLDDAPVSRVNSGLGAGVGFHAQDGGFWASEQSAGHGPRPFVVFNPTAHARREVVEATIWANGPDWQTALKNRRFAVRTPDGALAPAQQVANGSYWGHEYAVLAFPAEAAGLGYGLYTVVEAEADAPAGAWLTGTRHHCGYAPAERTPEGLENDFLLVELDTVTGGITRLTDKRSGLVIVEDAPALEYAVERPHGMTAWSIENTGPTEYPRVTAIRRTLDGPHKAALAVDVTIHESNFTLTYELRAGDPRLHVGISGVWFQRGTPQTGVPALAFALPLALDGAAGRYEIPFGAIDRSWNAGEEVPAQRWAQVTGMVNGKTAGCLLANDSKYGHALDGSTLRVTLIRSSYDPDILPEIGQHDIRFAILPFAGELPVAEAIQMGQDCNHALRAVGTDVHAGDLPAAGQFIRVDGPVSFSAMKKAEGDHAVIVRLFNPADEAATATVAVDPALGAVTCATTVDLLERPLDRCNLKQRDNATAVAVPPRGIVSVMMTLA